MESILYDTGPVWVTGAATVSSSTTHLAYTSAVGDTSEGDRTDSVTGSPW